jgi:uncharacterized protein YjbJ (UPF0337 family)
MNSDNIKGTIDDAAGRAKRQVGEWTGDIKAEVEGAAQQIKGKAEKVVGSVRDAVNNATNRRVENDRDINNRDVDRDIDDKDIDDNLNRETVRERE